MKQFFGLLEALLVIIHHQNKIKINLNKKYMK